MLTIVYTSVTKMVYGINQKIQINLNYVRLCVGENIKFSWGEKVFNQSFRVDYEEIIGELMIKVMQVKNILLKTIT